MYCQSFKLGLILFTTIGRPTCVPRNPIGSLACQSTSLALRGFYWLLLLSVDGDGAGAFPGALLQHRVELT